MLRCLKAKRMALVANTNEVVLTRASAYIIKSCATTILNSLLRSQRVGV